MYKPIVSVTDQCLLINLLYLSVLWNTCTESPKIMQIRFEYMHCPVLRTVFSNWSLAIFVTQCTASYRGCFQLYRGNMVMLLHLKIICTEASISATYHASAWQSLNYAMLYTKVLRYGNIANVPPVSKYS